MNNKKVEINNSNEISKYSDFHYALIESSLTNHKEVRVVFKYEGETVTHYVYVREVSGKPDSYYLSEAKSKVDQAIADGTILKEVKLSRRTRKVKIATAKSSKGAKVALAFTAVIAVALASLIAYYFLTLKKTITVSVDPNGGAFIERDSNARHSYAIKNFEVDPGYTWKQLKEEEKIEIGIMPEGGAVLECWQYYDGSVWKDISEDEVTFNNDTKIKAKYDYWSDKMTVIVDPNGACFANGEYRDKVRTIFVENGKTWGDVKNQFEIDKNTIPSDRYRPEIDPVYKVYNGHEPVLEDRWKEINDNYPLYGTQEIRAFYQPKICNITFEDKYDGLVRGKPNDIPVRALDEQWRDVRSVVDKQINDPTNKKAGYDFYGYYIQKFGGGLVPIEDTQTFAVDTTIYLMWNITINFKDDPLEDKHGTLPYADYRFLSGTEWGDVQKQFEPSVEKGWVFDKFRYIDPQDPSETRHDVDENTIIDHYTTFMPHYVPAEASDFVNDPWPTFLYEIEGKSFEQLTAEGAPYYDEYMGNGGSFVGLEREIVIYGRKYRVRVIDEDFTRVFEDINYEQYRKLAFEFRDELNFEIPFNQETSINNYFNSTIDRYLNEDVFAALPSSLQDYLDRNPTRVESWQIEKDDPSTGEMKYASRPLFALSAFEMGVEKYPAPIKGGEEKDVITEGAHLYKYYDVNQTGGDLSEKRKKDKAGGIASDYWLRSPDLSYIYGAWQIDVTDGEIGVYDEDDEVRYSQQITDIIAIAPAFEL